MRGKTAASSNLKPVASSCFNEAPLLCGERRGNAPDRRLGQDRFNEAPLLCGERRGSGRTGLDNEWCFNEAPLLCGERQNVNARSI